MSKEIKYNMTERVVIYLLSVLAGIFFIVASMLLLSGLMLATDMSESYCSVLSGVSSGVGGLVAGFLASKKIKSGGIINGLICGAIIYAFILFFSLFLSDKGFSLITVYHSLITVISSIIGGILGVNSAHKRKIV